MSCPFLFLAPARLHCHRPPATAIAIRRLPQNLFEKNYFHRFGLLLIFLRRLATILTSNALFQTNANHLCCVCITYNFSHEKWFVWLVYRIAKLTFGLNVVEIKRWFCHLMMMKKMAFTFLFCGFDFFLFHVVLITICFIPGFALILFSWVCETQN